jgi:hypothetical protein
VSESLLAPTFLFRFSAPLAYREPLWPAKSSALDEKCRLLPFGDLDGRRMYADVRGAWSDAGLAFSVRVEGKRQPVWCREARLEDSDGFALWIDTRDTQNVHRATRFCHRFMFLPSGGGRQLAEPVADQLLVDRARENARPIRPGILQVRSEKRVDGYILEALIPGEALTGWGPADHPKLGFAYAVVDRELGIQTYTIGTEFPFESDPSLWATLELARDAK